MGPHSLLSPVLNGPPLVHGPDANVSEQVRMAASIWFALCVRSEYGDHAMSTSTLLITPMMFVTPARSTRSVSPRTSRATPRFAWLLVPCS